MTVACPTMAPEVAVIVAVPTMRAVTVPAVPTAFDTDATATPVDAQTTLEVRSTMLPSA